MCVAEPRTNGHSVLRMKDIGRRRVVNYDSFLQVPTDLGKILKTREHRYEA